MVNYLCLIVSSVLSFRAGTLNARLIRLNEHYWCKHRGKNLLNGQLSLFDCFVGFIVQGGDAQCPLDKAERALLV